MADQVRLLDAPEAVAEDISAFAEQHSLEHKPGVLQRAALLIQNDGAIDTIPGIALEPLLLSKTRRTGNGTSHL